MINILLLGGSGFIGKNVIEYFSNFNNINLDYPASSKLNILNEHEVFEFLKTKHYDIVLNFALYIDLVDKNKDYNRILEYNLRMYYNFQKYSFMFGKMFYLGSGAEFNRSFPIVNVRENDFINPIPTDNYGLMKYIIGKNIENTTNIYNLRLCGVFGKYENYNQRFISYACYNAIKGLSINIKQNVYFDYLYIKDFLKILVRIIFAKELNYHTYNVCSGEKIDLIHICKLLSKVVDKRINYTVLKYGLQNEYTASNDRLINEFKDLKFTNYEQSIGELYYWYCENLMSF